VSVAKASDPGSQSRSGPVDVRSTAGERLSSVDLDPSVFGVEPNMAVMHQVVTAQLAAARAGDHNTLTRAEVRGGGRKPWRQKGSGRARQGSIRAPHWTGGGVATGPRTRDYRQRTPKKMVQLALRSALSDRASEGRIAVVDTWNFAAPRTKDARTALAALGLEGRVLVVLDRDQETVYKSFRNLPQVHVLVAGELNAYDVLCSDWVVFTKANLPAGTPSAKAKPASSDSAKPASKPSVATPAPADAADTEFDWDASVVPPAEGAGTTEEGDAR